MSETPSNEPLSATEDVAAPAVAPTPAPAPTTTAVAPRPSKLPLRLAIAALVLALLGIAGAAYGYFFPSETAAAEGKYSDQQRNDAKKHTCENFKLADHAVVRNSRLKNPENSGPIGALSIATTQHFAFYSGGDFLIDRVASEPATPKELADNVKALGSQLEELSIRFLAGSQDFTQDELRQGLDEKIKKIVDLCK